MVILRSIPEFPEFSTMCINAIDFVGDAMICKGSVFNTINCYDSPSRDEETSSKTKKILQDTTNIYKDNTARCSEDDVSSRYGELTDIQSLSSSVHQLLQDSSERESLYARTDSTTMLPRCRIQVHDDDKIFRSVEQDTSNAQFSKFCTLNRCTAWCQDESYYSFDDSERHSRVTEESHKRSTTKVRLVHWDEIVNDSLYANKTNFEYNIFRSNDVSSLENGDNKRLNLCKTGSMSQRHNEEGHPINEASSLG